LKIVSKIITKTDIPKGLKGGISLYKRRSLDRKKGVEESQLKVAAFEYI